ncbi:MAG TPA: transcription antitermination factor NusB [Nitrospiria bacterium]
MGSRRKSRELALQMLFQLDTNKDRSGWRALFWTLHPAEPEIRAFSERLLDGVMTHQEEIDRLIQKHATNWKISRMPVVDRNILRCAVFELLHEKDVPASVVIDEAIEIAKRFSDENAGAFVNGVLDHIVKEVSLVQGDA